MIVKCDVEYIPLVNGSFSLSFCIYANAHAIRLACNLCIRLSWIPMEDFETMRRSLSSVCCAKFHMWFFFGRSEWQVEINLIVCVLGI